MHFFRACIKRNPLQDKKHPPHRLTWRVKRMQDTTTTTARKLLTRPEAAEHLAVSLRVLDELAAKRKLKFVKIGSSVRYRIQSLESFIQANEK